MSADDDTRRRSVAELMGWRDAGGYGCEKWYWDGSGKQRRTPIDGPTVDDMLRWLREQGCDVVVVAADDVETIDVNVGEPGCVMVPFCDDTVHAALEAAVRAVAEAGDE